MHHDANKLALFPGPAQLSVSFSYSRAQTPHSSGEEKGYGVWWNVKRN